MSSSGAVTLGEIARRLIPPQIAGCPLYKPARSILSASEETLHRRIVPTICLAAHRLDDGGGLQDIAISAGSVLTAAVGVMDAALWLRGLRWRCRNRCPETSSGLNATVGTEKPIPEKINHREIAVPIAVVDEMELLLSPEPGKAAKP